jgi:heat shock protein HspQ
MTDPGQIPFLIQLLDEESTDIQEAAFRELAAFGPNLKAGIRGLPFKFSAVQRYYLDLIFQGQKRVRLRRMWPSWQGLEDEHERVESALSILSDFLSPGPQSPNLTGMLNSLAFSYRVKYFQKDPKTLAGFLFKERGLEGNENDYYNPQNSNLAYVIKHRRGIPVSLATIYLLVGRRLGIDIEGRHFPGHFLARTGSGGKTPLADGFSPGQVLESQKVIYARDDLMEDISNVLDEKVEAQGIVRLYLANLIRVYRIQEADEDCELMIDLFKDMEFRSESRMLRDITPEHIIVRPEARFKSGDVIVHRRYGYRGIVVDVDEECCATDDWYYSNQTQPDRYQPWLHILVDGAEQVAYVAQSSVEKDGSREKIRHSLLAYFFTKVESGRYIRNENPWPETDF